VGDERPCTVPPRKRKIPEANIELLSRASFIIPAFLALFFYLSDTLFGVAFILLPLSFFLLHSAYLLIMMNSEES
jgi:hypothetical protein